MENQRLLAHFEFTNRGANKDDGTTHKPAIPYRAPKVPAPVLVPSLIHDLEDSTTNFNENSTTAKDSKYNNNSQDVIDELSQFEMSAFVPELKVKSSMPRSISLPMFIKPVHDDMVKDKVVAAILNATAPLGNENIHVDRTYSIPIVESKVRKMSKGNTSSAGEGDDSINPLISKNEFTRSSADEKIAKLMEMNLHEIKAMKIQVTKIDKQPTSLSTPPTGVSAGGSVASSRQSSQLKTKSSRESKKSDLSMLITMGKALPRKESKESHSRLSNGGSSILDQPDRSVHMEESTSTLFNDSVTMLPAISTSNSSNNNNNNHSKKRK